MFWKRLLFSYMMVILISLSVLGYLVFTQINTNLEDQVINSNDIILEVNGKRINDSRDLSRLIAEIPVGKKIPIKVLRNGKIKKLHALIAKRTDEKEEIASEGPDAETDFGVTVGDITPEIADRYGFEVAEGVVITRVAQGSKGAEAGLEAGDIIKEISCVKE